MENKTFYTFGCPECDCGSFLMMTLQDDDGKDASFIQMFRSKELAQIAMTEEFIAASVPIVKVTVTIEKV